MLEGENIGEFSYLNYLGEKTLTNGILIKCRYSINLREKTLVTGHQLAKFVNVFSLQHFFATCMV